MWALMPYCTGRAKAASAAHVWVGLAQGPAAGPGYGYCINSALVGRTGPQPGCKT